MSYDHLTTRDDLDEVFGPIEPSNLPPHVTPHLSLVKPSATDDDLPSADEMADEQYKAAVQRLFEDTTQYPAFPWPNLADLAGPMCPEDLVLVAARTGGGKSLFLQNLFDAMVSEGRTGLYAGLEQSPQILRIKWACLRAMVPPKLVLATRKEERGGQLWQEAMAKVQDELAWMKSPEIKRRAHFAAARRINKAGLKRWTEWAVDHRCQFVVIDHVDRMDHGDGKNAFHELSETIQLAKELAVQHHLVMLMATQVGRPADGLAAFMPPALHELRGAGTKEEEADTVLGIYRPLKPETTNKQLHAVRQGLSDRDTVVEQGTMGIQLLKHRLDGPVAGKMVKLAVEHGRVTHLPERHRVSTTYDAMRRT
jgi:replicative DNA helicase